MKQALIYVLLTLGVLLLITTLIFHTYFSLDEPNILWAYRTGQAWSGYYYRFVQEGRPLYGLLQIGGIAWAKTFSGLKFLRVISVALTMAFCTLVFLFLKRNKLGAGFSLLFSILIFTLPGFSVFIGWAQQYPHHLSSIASFVSGICLVTVFGEYLDRPVLTGFRNYLMLFLALMLEEISLMNYQNMALAILLPPFFMLLSHPHIPNRKRIIFILSVLITYLVFLGLYFELFKWMLEKTHVQMIDRGAFGSDPIHKFIWFIYVLTEAAKLHLLLIKSDILASVFSFCIVLVLIRDLLKKRFLDIFSLCLFCTGVFLPHLLIRESWAASRNFCLISVLMTFYLLIRSFELIPKPSIGLALCTGLPFIAMMCFNISEAWVKPQELDYKQLSVFVDQLPAPRKHKIEIEVVLAPDKIHETHSLLKCYRDEFNASLFFPEWPVEPALKILYNNRFPEIPALETDKNMVVTICPDGGFLKAPCDSIFHLNLDRE